MAKPTTFPKALPAGHREVFTEAFELLSAISPTLSEDARMTLAESLVKSHGLNLDAYRLNFQLTGYGDRIKNTTPYNYYLKDVPMTGNIMETLGHAVYFAEGGNSSKVVAVDAPARLVLTESGSIYYLGAQVPTHKVGSVLAPSAWPFPRPTASDRKFVAADELACDPAMAKEYVENREKDARTFTKSLVWGNQDIRWPHCIYADVYGYRVVHDLSGRVLNTVDPRWGELVKIEGTDVEEIERFETFDCFVAYMLAKFW